MASAVRNFVNLVRHEARTELRNKQALTGLLVYSIASIFITYLCFRYGVDPLTWNALFWLIMLFAATNAVARSFLQETRGLQLYYYTLLNPAEVILAKTTSNFFLLLGLGLINTLVFSAFFNLEIGHPSLFLFVLVTGSLGMSSILTLVSGIVSKAQGSSALVAILGFPLLLPLLISIIGLSKLAINYSTGELPVDEFFLLPALDLIILLLSYILFPYLWRE